MVEFLQQAKDEYNNDTKKQTQPALQNGTEKDVDTAFKKVWINRTTYQIQGVISENGKPSDTVNFLPLNKHNINKTNYKK